GKLSEAIEKYQQVLQWKPDHSAAHNNLGLAYLKTGRLHEAIEHFQTAVELNPKYTEAYANLALAYAKTKQSPLAIEAARKALELARNAGRTEMVKQIEAWLKSYEARKATGQKKIDE
ncbi:MAG: tetratricopeptide repeat protein, partial [Thermoguttaceae bacterium]